MAISRAKVAAAALVAASLAAAAVAQSNKNPESLLPPGFDEPPAPPAAPGKAPAASAPAPVAPSQQPLPSLALGNSSEPAPTPSATATPDAAQLAQYEMPPFARRSLSLVGPTGTAEGGLAPNAWGNADGRYLEILMRRLSAPLPSRWLSIALRRALLSQVDTPYGLNGADFAAERAWLLLRMGESVSARALVQSVDTANVTPKLRDVWMNAALATADPGALCPLTDAALRNDNQPGWVLAQAMCTALVGNPGEAQPLIAQARRAHVADGIDLQLAQKVVGAGADSRQAITIEWTPVVQLNVWRFGLATATGIAVPASLYDTVGPQVTGWRALAPAIPLADRVAPAERAAAMGVLSNLALVDLYGAIDAAEDMPAALSATAADLRSAYAGADVATRLGALRQLWEGGTTPDGKYARLILTARAAARVRPGDGKDEADRIVAAMLSAGMDRTAMRWRDTVAQGSDGWAMLALADPDNAPRVGYGQVSGYASGRKQQLFFAGLAGLGRLSPADIERGAQALDVKIGTDNAWTRALDRATRDRQPATVLLLAAIGMQTASWHGVPPEALYRIVTALRIVGLDAEARMIAVEALTRI